MFKCYSAPLPCKNCVKARTSSSDARLLLFIVIGKRMLPFHYLIVLNAFME